jgi:hypothetical protein
MKLKPFPKKHIHDVTSGRSLLHRFSRDAFTDWTVIFILSFGLAIFLIGLGASTYLNLEQSLADRETMAKTSSTITIDTKSLDAILNDFDARAAARADLLRGYSGPADPSQ